LATKSIRLQNHSHLYSHLAQDLSIKPDMLYRQIGGKNRTKGAFTKTLFALNANATKTVHEAKRLQAL